jgi:hypothetical protein
LRIHFKSTDDNVKDLGIGEGVEQEGITMYWNAVQKLGLFQPSYFDNGLKVTV